jgi:hypothetical protein
VTDPDPALPPESSPAQATRLARIWPVAAVVGLLIGFLLLQDGARPSGGLRAPLCGIGAALLLARAYATAARPIATAVLGLVLIVWAAAVIGAIGGRDLERLATKYDSRIWSHYHYYLGAKYFSELGYTDLYDQTFAVDREHDQQLVSITWMRDLRTYEREATNYFGRERAEVWTDARWHQFSEDVLWFLPHQDVEHWRSMVRDRGYNATPTSNTLYWLLGQIPLNSRNLALIGALDPLLLAFAFVLAGIVFGPIRSMTAAAWVLIFFGSMVHVVGGPLQFDYLAALVLMACAVHRNRPMTAGALLGYAAMTRVFPGFLIAGLVVWTVVAMRRDGTFPRFTNRFARGLLAACALLFVVGCLNARGVKAWGDWSENMSLHSDHHRFGNKRLGLQHLFTHDMSLEFGDWRTAEWRRRTWPKQQGWWLAAALGLSALWLVAAWRGATGERDPLDSLVFALALVFAGVVLSRYYWTVACLFFLVGGRERDGPREAWLGAGLLGLVALYYAWLNGFTSAYGRYVVANAALGLLLVLALIARSIWRVKADAAVPDAVPTD